MFATRLPAYLATAIPLRHAAAGSSAQDDDAKHDPSPENENLRPNTTKVDTGPDMPCQGVSPEVHLRRNT